MTDPASIDPPRNVLVVIRATDPRRAAEAMRAAIGLTLRGDKVATVVPEIHSKDPAIARGIATLLLLKQRVWAPMKLAELVRAADRIEVWT